MRSRTLLAGALAVGISAGALYFFNFRWRDETPRFIAPAVNAVRVAPVRSRLSPGTIVVKGELLPVQQIEIESHLTGKVVETRAKVGELVSAGKVLATVHAPDLVRRVAELETAVGAAQGEARLREQQAAEASKRVEAKRALLERDLIARRELEQSVWAAETAKAQADLARARGAQQEALLAQARELQKFAHIAAPRSGLITRRWVEAGAAIGAGKPVFTLVSLETLKLIARVAPAQAGATRRGLKARVIDPAAPDQALQGEVVRLGPAAGTDGLAEIEIRIGNRDRFFRPGMNVEASIALDGQQEHLLIPKSAVTSEDDVSFVYRVIQGRIERRRVRLAREEGAEWVVLDGLAAGDAVIVDSRAKLAEGAPVLILNE